MKKLLTSLLLAATFSAGATGTFTLVTAPCNHDGQLKITYPSSLTPPLTIVWQTYGTAGTTITHTTTGLFDVLYSYSGGPVMVSVTDYTGATDSTSYYSGAAPFTIIDSIGQATCPLLDTATAYVSGGTAPFTYQWYNAATSAIISTTNPAFLTDGTYGVTVTDAAGCVYGSADDDLPIYIYSIPAFNLSNTTTTAACTNGTATVSVAGGTATPPLSYHWSNGATSAVISGLAMGSYSVMVTDALGCTASSYPYVDQSITISAPTTPTPATCLNSDGAIIAFGAGGVPPYSYIWSNGATTQSQTGIPSGSYGVTVTDANGCIGSGSGYVGASTPITATYSATPSQCTVADGTATLVLAGGTTPYAITWYTTPVQTAVTATSLAPGDYPFHVTDAVGCVRNGAVHVPPVSIISATYSTTPALCTLSTGGMTAFPAGGVAPYTYSWSTGATTSSISGVPGGYYSVTITDAMSCHISKLWEVPVNSPISLGVSMTPATCIFNNDGSLHATPTGGTAPYLYSWTSGATTATAPGLHYGPYWVTVSDAMGCVAHDYSYVSYDATADDCYCTIEGTVYDDANNNCTQDAGEAGISHVQIYCSGRGYTYTDASGHYSFLVPSGTYTVTQSVLAFYPLASCQANNIVVTATAASGCIHTVDFADTTYPIHDIHLCTWDWNKPVPGNAYHHVTVVKNDGTVSEPAILAGYKPDGQLLSPSFTPSGIFAGAPYYYNTSAGFPALVPGGSETFYMNYTVPTSIPLGTSVLFKDTAAYQAPMNNWLTDYSPWNNLNYFSTVVVSSYDPNFKEVSPKGIGATGIITTSDSVLEYMVHFQNTGTAPAQNIVVIDTIDNNLDWTFLRPSYESAPCKVTMQQVGAYKIATFLFANINLPAQTMDDFRSNGMFSYTIRQKAGLVAGDQMKNNASIYFDYNAPVKTNTTINTIGTPTAVSNPAATAANAEAAFTVYPNPAASAFYVRISSDMATTGSMKVTDITGKVIIAKSVDMIRGTQTIATDINDFAAGVYFVSITANGKTNTQKLVVIR